MRCDSGWSCGGKRRPAAKSVSGGGGGICRLIGRFMSVCRCPPGNRYMRNSARSSRGGVVVGTGGGATVGVGPRTAERAPERGGGAVVTAPIAAVGPLVVGGGA